MPGKPRIDQERKEDKVKQKYARKLWLEELSDEGHAADALKVAQVKAEFSLRGGETAEMLKVPSFSYAF